MKDKEEKIAENFKLIPVKDHKMINRILVIVTIAIVVIVTSSIAGIFVASNMRKKEEEQIAKKQDETVQGENQQGQNADQDNQVEENKPRLPVYSEEAKQNFKNIYVSNNDEKVAYLTFDDGPSKQITPQILEILKNENIKASFFVLGNRVATYPNLVKQEYEEGHYSKSWIFS